jgi:phosphatidylserine decarboxylase
LKNYPHPVIAREGWPYLILSIALALFVTYFSLAWAIPFWILSVLILQFFRDQARTVPREANAVLSPADGRIVAVEKTDDPYVGREALRISVFMHAFNVHSNRSPVDGRIESAHYFPGRPINADPDTSSGKNERNALTIKSAGGHLITCVQTAGLIARRIFCDVRAGDILSRGQRFGFIRFGSRVDIYLPLTARLKVTVGDKVFATETILAQL